MVTCSGDSLAELGAILRGVVEVVVVTHVFGMRVRGRFKLCIGGEGGFAEACAFGVYEG
jgi:hypothetical protein